MRWIMAFAACYAAILTGCGATARIDVVPLPRVSRQQPDEPAADGIIPVLLGVEDADGSAFAVPGSSVSDQAPHAIPGGDLIEPYLDGAGASKTQ
jgi:hypothetical protein